MLGEDNYQNRDPESHSVEVQRVRWGKGGTKPADDYTNYSMVTKIRDRSYLTKGKSGYLLADFHII
jgi:hypothetical protein